MSEPVIRELGVATFGGLWGRVFEVVRAPVVRDAWREHFGILAELFEASE